MKPKEDESFDSWCNRVKMYEHGVALQRIAKGEDPELVMTEMSNRMISKFLHPVYEAIRDSVKEKYDPEKAKQNYKERYLDKVAPAADHIVDENNS